MSQQNAVAKPAPLAVSTTSPAHITQGKEVRVDVFHLDEIPDAMDKMGWPVSARMMRRWFANSPAYAMPETIRRGKGVDYLKLPASQIDDQIITMDWVLSFPRVKPVFDELCRAWNNSEGIRVLREDRLRPAGWQSGTTFALGQGLSSAKALDSASQVNSRAFGAYPDTFDDLFGAIFKATLKLAVVGTAYRSSQLKRDIFEVDKIGVYVRDTYDFNSSWFNDGTAGLGIWSRDRLLGKAEMVEYRMNETNAPVGWMANYIKYNGFVPVRNRDFQRWQEKHNSGGDFFVFSDVKWIQPNVDHVVL
jgi:hypothetical protein